MVEEMKVLLNFLCSLRELKAKVSRKGRKDFHAKIAERPLKDEGFQRTTISSSIIKKTLNGGIVNFLCALCVIFPLRPLREIKAQVSRKACKDLHAKIAEISLKDEGFQRTTISSSIIKKTLNDGIVNFLCALCVIFPLRSLREIEALVSRKNFHAKIAERPLVNLWSKRNTLKASTINKALIWNNLEFLCVLCVIFPLRSLREINYQELININ